MVGAGQLVVVVVKKKERQIQMIRAMFLSLRAKSVTRERSTRIDGVDELLAGAYGGSPPWREQKPPIFVLFSYLSRFDIFSLPLSKGWRYRRTKRRS